MQPERPDVKEPVIWEIPDFYPFSRYSGRAYISIGDYIMYIDSNENHHYFHCEPYPEDASIEIDCDVVCGIGALTHLCCDAVKCLNRDRLDGKNVRFREVGINTIKNFKYLKRIKL